MQLNFYITNGNCGLKFANTVDRDEFWNSLAVMQRNGFTAQEGAEPIGNRTIRFYPAKMKEGFEWPMITSNATSVSEVQTSTQPINVHLHTQKPQPDTITTANPFANLATNPTRPLPGLCPPVPPEMLAVTEPAPQAPPEPITFTNTETSQQATVPPIGEAGESPKGLGTDGNKPLMRNQQANDEPSATGDTGGTNLHDPEPQKPQAHHRSKIFLQWKKEHAEWQARQKS